MKKGIFLFFCLVLVFFSNVEADPSTCKYFKEDFSGLSTNTWTSASGHWYVDSGKLNVDKITSGKMASYQTSFYPDDFFMIDTDVEVVSIADGGAYGIYPFTHGDVFFGVNDKALQGIGALLAPSGNAYLIGFDSIGGKWYTFAKYLTTPPVTSIGVAYTSDKVTLRINKQNQTFYSGSFGMAPSVIDSLWLMAQGDSTHVRFDNICADPIGATPNPTPTPTPTPAPSGCTATLSGNLLLHIPYLSYVDPASGTLLLWADLVYNPNPMYPTLIPFKLTNFGIINDPSFSCTVSTLSSSNFTITIPDVLFSDGTTHLWMYLEFSPALSTDGNAYFVAINYGNAGFQYGAPMAYGISSTTDTSVKDSLTGNTFWFPQGGKGTLSITPISSAPEDGPAAGSGFSVEYSGTETLQMLIPYKTGEVPLLWIWEDPATSVYESNAPPETWMPVLSADIIANPAMFPLWLSIDSTTNPEMRLQYATMPTKNPTMKLWQAKLNSSSGSKAQVYYDLASQDIQTNVNLLPSAIQTKAMTEINGRLKPVVRPYTFASISSYHPFSHLTGDADPYFVFVAYNSTYGTLATVATVAHEVGHYMSHVLLGDAKMRTLEAQANRAHDFGDPHAGRPMLEEYAMFSDYCINNSVSGGAIDDPWALLVNNSDSPNIRDWPSKEGYAISLLALMHANNALLKNSRSGDPEYIPLVNASLTDLWGILAKGPLTVDELYLYIEAYMSSLGKHDRLAPLLERTGWSYMGNGRIVDLQNKPIPFGMVQAVAKVPSEGTNKEYLAPLSPVQADKDGNFTINRIFPGNNFIRVWPSQGGKNFSDSPLTADHAKPTNVALILGDVIYDPAVDDGCKGCFPCDTAPSTVTCFLCCD